MEVYISKSRLKGEGKAEETWFLEAQNLTIKTAGRYSLGDCWEVVQR